MNLRKLFVVFALAPLFATQLLGVKSAHIDQTGARPAANEWQRYKVEDEEFSVSLPVAPAMNTDSITFAPNQSRRERTLAAYADGVVYAIDAVEKKGITLDELIRRNIASGPITSVTVDGVAGKSSTGEIDNMIWHSKWFETTRRLYKFSAFASKLVDSSAATTSFLSSISFRKNQDGRKVFDGPGEQPLSHENGAQVDSMFRSSEVTARARVLSRPEPPYTESARRNQVTGTVVLRGIFSKSGAVENITVLRDLPEGLTEKAITAARQIRFIPAIKDGRFVSMRMQLEYNFNLY